jgi:hypothetical protein
MKAILLAATFTLAAGNVYAASCTAEAAKQKLAGAAKSSFMTKCEKDAQASCDKEATAKNLAGAAKASFTTKCVKDAVGG